mmetsp:Transcript_34216/g.90678  ORF Transcript_34216/g.90678 Transcript_34216/m.90678 type:complete len:439 (+) Transcript_34216:125-1441(+)
MAAQRRPLGPAARSLPHGKGRVGAGAEQEVVAGGLEGHVLDRVVVAFEVGHKDAILDVEGLDGRVSGGDREDLPAAVEGRGVRRVLAGVDLQVLRDDAHVPELHNAVRVAGGDRVAPKVERGLVASVGVAVEGLDAEPGAQVPHGNGLVAGGREHGVRERLEGNVVHRVHVPAQRLSALARLQVEHLRRLVHGGAHQEVAKVVEGASPHGLVVVRERVLAPLLRHVPQLDGHVPGGRRHERAARVEGDAADPVPVPLAAEHQLPLRHGPHLPGVVVAGRRDDGDLRVLRVEGDAGDGPEVAFECLLLLHVRDVCRLNIGFCVRVRAVVARPLRELGLLGREAVFLPRQARLLLRVRLRLSQLLLQRLDLREEAVPLKAHEHLLLHRNLILVSQLRERRLVLLVVLLEPLEVYDELVLLLDNASVVHAVEVALLAELVP